MEIIIGLVILAAAVYYFTRKRDVAEANAETPVALGEPPATVVVPVSESTLVVEGAGAVEVPAKKAKAKKPAAIKAAKPKAPKAAKSKAPAKPKAKKPATK